MGIYYPLIKMFLIFAFFLAFKIFFSNLISVFLCVLIVLAYPYWVASVVPNTIVMPSMDQQTYVSNQTQLVNYMNCSMYDKGDIEAIELCFKKAVSDFPKMRYKVKEIFGDYYYEEMSVEETIQKVLLYPEGDDKILRSQADINAYIRDNLNVKMPLDGPLFRVYVQNFEPTDQDGVPEAQKSKSFLI